MSAIPTSFRINWKKPLHTIIYPAWDNGIEACLNSIETKVYHSWKWTGDTAKSVQNPESSGKLLHLFNPDLCKQEQTLKTHTFFFVCSF